MKREREEKPIIPFIKNLLGALHEAESDFWMQCKSMGSPTVKQGRIPVRWGTNNPILGRTIMFIVLSCCLGQTHVLLPQVHISDQWPIMVRLFQPTMLTKENHLY